ncbi:DUF6851 domain-containing protein [Streptomyces sp. CMB-StM0423]|uniref:DUF6851 domain-containing protein n=1 Tax=Streptomyces sp. CMB-StM0423 TaxID=2059884 RepID=UPI0018FE5EB1|nr:hypothetical protein [Streptomyces sp. CMB-StM0423]
MTTSGSSSVPGFSPRRRSLLLGSGSAAALATLGHAGTAAAEPGPAAEPPPAFDLDKGNFVRDLLTVAGDSSGETQDLGPADVTLIFWIQDVMQTAWFDALAPYHPTAVGVRTRLPRRPAGESETNRNKNIAGLYATYQVVSVAYPERGYILRGLLEAIGLDPDDESEDPATPAGIGNLAGKAAVAARRQDGMNFLGDENRKYHRQPFEDYTGYEPVNTAYKLVNPSRWQPARTPHRRRVGGGPGDKGIFTVQHFATPQLRLVQGHTFRDPGRFELAPPDHSDHTAPGRYKRAVDEILGASAALTDEQKAKAEFFSNNYQGILLATRAAAVAHDLDLDGWVHLYMTSSVAQLDNLIASWHLKHAYDAVRPFSAVRHVYGRQKVRAWGGPGKGTVDLRADEWAGYLPVNDHPEYPSGSTALCAAMAQGARRFLGDDVLKWTYTFKAGSTLTEPGLVPARDVELNYGTWTTFVRDAALSRVWAGVNFTKTAERSVEFGKQFGDLAHEFVQRHVSGEAED